MPLDFDSIEASPYNHSRLLFFHYCQSRVPRPVGEKTVHHGSGGSEGRVPFFFEE